jgi:hypothetical protein
VEGAEKIHELGMNVVKFWLHEDSLPGYGYNSDWQIPLDSRLVDLLQHKYYVEALALPGARWLLKFFRFRIRMVFISIMTAILPMKKSNFTKSALTC